MSCKTEDEKYRHTMSVLRELIEMFEDNGADSDEYKVLVAARNIVVPFADMAKSNLASSRDYDKRTKLLSKKCHTHYVNNRTAGEIVAVSEALIEHAESVIETLSDKDTLRDYLRDLIDNLQTHLAGNVTRLGLGYVSALYSIVVQRLGGNETKLVYNIENALMKYNTVSASASTEAMGL